MTDVIATEVFKIPFPACVLFTTEAKNSSYLRAFGGIDQSVEAVLAKL